MRGRERGRAEAERESDVEFAKRPSHPRPVLSFHTPGLVTLCSEAAQRARQV